MREVLPVVSDDLTWTEEKIREPATEVVSVGYMGTWFELDLTGANALQLRDIISRYTRAGRPTSTPVTARRGGGAGHTSDSPWARMARYREWHLAAYGAAVVRNEKDKYVYDPKRVKRFDAWEAEHGPYNPSMKELVRGLGSDRPE